MRPHPFFSSIIIRMKKIIFAFLLIILECNATIAGYADNCKNFSDIPGDCSRAPGCEWTDSAICEPCKFGYFKSGTGEECTPCDQVVFLPQNNSRWDEDVVGAEKPDDCAYITRCEKGYFINFEAGCNSCYSIGMLPNNDYDTQDDGTYIIKTTIGEQYDNSSMACIPCPENSTAVENKKKCVCASGYHVSGQTDETKQDIEDPYSNTCSPNNYTITYNPGKGSGETITQKITYNQLFTTKTGPELNFAYEGYNLAGWKNDTNPSETLSPGTQYQYTYTSNITLTAQWQGKKFTIKYDLSPSSCTIQEQTCYYEGDCTAQSPGDCTYSGYIFNGWEYNSTTIKSGENISTMSNGNDMELTAIWEKCPAGKYCTNVVTELSCPAGSTSEAGSTAITACYMTGSTTKICDKDNNCFTLPGSSKIYYHGGTQ